MSTSAALISRIRSESRKAGGGAAGGEANAPPTLNEEGQCISNFGSMVPWHSLFPRPNPTEMGISPPRIPPFSCCGVAFCCGAPVQESDGGPRCTTKVC